MKICFTVCSLNRLGQVITLANSLLEFNPDYKFICCLVDEIDGRVDTGQYPHIEFIEYSALDFRDKDVLSSRYDIFELSCVCKPYFGLQILKTYQPDLLVYLDTDICVYSSLYPVELQMASHSILISPHFISPPPGDNKFPRERDVLNSGLYNGGFFCVKNDEASVNFLHWWKERLFDQGFNNVCEGMMVDQLWLNLVPFYFKEAGILQHAGCNLAYWNLHERKLEWNGVVFKANGEDLVFFHFSGYRVDEPTRLSLHQNRFSDDDPVIKRIVNWYHHKLEKNHFIRYLDLVPYYGIKNKKKKMPVIRRAIINILARFGYALEKIRRID